MCKMRNQNPADVIITNNKSDITAVCSLYLLYVVYVHYIELLCVAFMELCVPASRCFNANVKAQTTIGITWAERQAGAIMLPWVAINTIKTKETNSFKYSIWHLKSHLHDIPIILYCDPRAISTKCIQTWCDNAAWHVIRCCSKFALHWSTCYIHALCKNYVSYLHYII